MTLDTQDQAPLNGSWLSGTVRMIQLHPAPLDAHPQGVASAPPPPQSCDHHCARVTCLPRLQTRVARVQVVSNNTEPGSLKASNMWECVVIKLIISSCVSCYLPVLSLLFSVIRKHVFSVFWFPRFAIGYFADEHRYNKFGRSNRINLIFQFSLISARMVIQGRNKSFSVKASSL